MIPNDPEERHKMIVYMLATCNNEANNLTKWEENFIISINEQFCDKGTLSDRQCEILETIYDKI